MIAPTEIIKGYFSNSKGFTAHDVAEALDYKQVTSCSKHIVKLMNSGELQKVGSVRTGKRGPLTSVYVVSSNRIEQGMGQRRTFAEQLI